MTETIGRVLPALLPVLLMAGGSQAQEEKRFGTGLLLPDRMEPEAVQVEDTELFGAAPLPKAVSWRDKLPPAGNQSETQMCVAWTLGYGLLSYLNSTPKTPCNPFYIYHFAVDHAVPDHARAPLADAGCRFDYAFEALIKNGACSFPDYTDFRYNPRQSLSEKARRRRVDLKLPVTRYDTRSFNLSFFKRLIGEGKVLPAGFHVYDDFESQAGFQKKLRPSTNKMVPVWSKPGPPFQGSIDRHAMLITGYDDDLNAFEVLNSYGDDWGDEGYIWIDYGFFKSMDSGNPKCCMFVYDYQQTVAAIIKANGGESAVREAVDNGELEGYCKVATFGGSDEKAVDNNFELPAGKDIDKLAVNDELKVKPGFGKLIVRGALAIDPKSGNTALGREIGNLRSGNHFKISDLRKVTFSNENKVEYWAKGTIQK